MIFGIFLANLVGTKLSGKSKPNSGVRTVQKLAKLWPKKNAK